LPGSFREATARPQFDQISNESQKELKANASLDLVARYRVFAETFNPDSSIVYYPCCAVDTSPSIAFSASRVIYVDKDAKAIQALQKDGREAHEEDARTFIPDTPVSILILLNPGILSEGPRKHVAPNGYVLCNDYHDTAHELRKSDDYEFVGIVRSDGDKYIVDREELGKCWEEVDTDEEFKNAPFSWSGVDYKQAANIVEMATGKRENVLHEYRRLLQDEQEIQRRGNAELLAGHPELANLNLDFGDIALIVTIKGRQLVLQTKFPMKKGVVDDIFIFRRKPSIVT